MREDRDLQEPVRRQHSPLEVVARRWDLRLGFLGLATAYAFLHKVIIPLVLQFTRLADSPYGRVDPGAIHSLLLFFAIRRRKFTEWAAFLSGAGVVYSLFEIGQVARNAYPGWLAFSHVISTVPVGIWCVFVLSSAYTPRKARIAWLGAAVFSGVLYVF